MDSKKCSACGVVKPITEFHKNRRIKDGLHYYCKICHTKRSMEFYTNNREKIREYYITIRESKLQYQNEYYVNNREKIREYWASPRGRLVDKAKQARRRALKLGNTPKELLLTNKQLETLYENSTHCPYCGIDLSTVDIHLDHVYPLSKGGQHTLDNVVLCCAQCNMNKGAREPIEWMLEQGIEFGFVTKAGFISAYDQDVSR